MKLGSLFDGSGGFPLAGALNGIEPLWASEVEPYPIAVTTSRFPHMKHLGDVSKVNGAEIEPVDIITFGSPCQDMSVAGKRAGIKHDDHGDEETTRSGLFYEAIRIIKEMRYGTEGRFPTFVVWENVPGAFSSNRGEDFRTVLEELVKIAEPTAVVPDVPQGGWAYADCWRGDGWSIGYRVFDAQHIRTAQRRKRIYLVLCLGDEDGAGKILFERDRLRGHYPQSGKAWERTPPPAEGSLDADDREGEVPYTLKIRSGCEGGGKGALVPLDKSATLATNNDQYLFQPLGADPYNGCLTGYASSTLGVNCGLATGRSAVVSFEPGIASREGGHIYEGVSGTLRANAGDNQMATAYAVENHPADSRVNIDESGTVQTLTSRMGTGGGNVPMVMEPFCKSRRAQSADDATTWKHGDKANTLNTFDQGEARANELVVETIPLEGNGQRPSHRGDGYAETDKSYTLNATEVHGVAYSFDPGASRDVGVLFIEECGKTLTNGTCPGHHDGVVIATQPAPLTASKASFFMNADENIASTLVATDYKDPQLVCYEDDEPIAIDRAYFNQGQNALYDPQTYEDGTAPTLVARGPSAVATRYIVRRLTPTECARLQGFPDRWGDIDRKETMTDEEFAFWLEVKQTYDRINGRAKKDYTDKQILAWYNKLHNDGAEYKMWGNGIALPCALYVMEGIVEVAT